ncbi:MAG: hypothetical protein QOJ51_6835 [Acidobacteriaceae bacterium]|jgi:hypothetical protein|nr:hypothetical protein [Acidobacteriaceae bacterium]
MRFARGDVSRLDVNGMKSRLSVLDVKANRFTTPYAPASASATDRSW